MESEGEAQESQGITLLYPTMAEDGVLHPQEEEVWLSASYIYCSNSLPRLLQLGFELSLHQTCSHVVDTIESVQDIHE